MGPTRIVPFAGGDRSLPSLALGGITAFARSRPGLDAAFRFVPQMTELAELESLLRSDSSPIVLLLSNYLWTAATNLQASALAAEVAPGSVTVHGGPHTPHYTEDNRRYFEMHSHVDVTVRQEGELTTARILSAFAEADRLDASVLAASNVPGCTVRTPAGLHRADDVERIDDLSVLPSAYLSGELSHLAPERWMFGIIETNRGCPYGCTFCDWGQATLSRVRKFPLERVLAEIDWLVDHRVATIFIADANFGIFGRDVEIADHIARRRNETGYPRHSIATFTKNTNRHVREIVEIWTSAGIWAEGVLSMQTTDPETLSTIRRQNIRTERFEELSAEFEALGLPVASDLIVGLPGSTVDSFRRDLQYFFDRHVMVRVFEPVLLPNSPMNEPAYRAEHRIVAGDDLRILSTSSYDLDDRDTMMRLRHWNRVAVDLGVLRETLRFLQREQGLPAADVLTELDRAVREEPATYPLANFLARHLDLFLVPPGSWSAFYREFRRFLHDRLGIEDLPGWDTVALVEIALRPAPGRHFPVRVELAHDFVAYAADPSPDARLLDYEPGVLDIDDPATVSSLFFGRSMLRGERTDAGANWFWWDASWELESPLTWPMARPSPHAAGREVDDVGVAERGS